MSTALSGQVTVTTAGTAVQGPSIPGEGWFIRALSANAGVVYLGNDGAADVASTNGYELAAGDQIYIEATPNLSQVWFDAAEDGDKVCWLRMKGGIE